MAVAAQAVRAQGLHDGVAPGGAHLQYHAQLFIEKGAQGEFFAAGADLLRPVFGVARVHAAVGNAVAFGHEHVHVQGHAHLAGKGHFAHSGQQPAVAAVVVGQYLAAGAQFVDGGGQAHQVLRVVQVGHVAAALRQRLRQDGAAHAALAPTQVDENKRRVGLVAVQLRGERAAHVIHAGKGADDQADGRDHLVRRAAGIRPLRAHGQAVFAHGNGNAQRRAQLQPHGFDGGVQRRVFARLAAGGHPVGAQLHTRQLYWRGQQVGEGLGHGHAA